MTARANITLVPMGRDDANAIVTKWHRHHKPVVGYKFAIGAKLAGEIVGNVIVSRPVAGAHDDGRTFEVTRHTCRGGDRNVASMLLAAARDAAFAMGYIAGISYTRFDEDGTAYKAAGWTPVATTGEVRGWGRRDPGRVQPMLPGFYVESTEPVERVRWETRPSAHLRAVSKMCAGIWRFGIAFLAARVVSDR